ncbi:PDZ domain-containing protein [Thermodesulfobacteriota bacterium]
MHLNRKSETGFRLFLAIFAMSAVFTFNISVYGQEETKKSIVKIHTTQRRPDLFNPWSKMPSNEISGSGVVIMGNKILTNAHVVIHASQVYVQPYQSAEKIPANITGIAPGIDLALLEIEDQDFFKEYPPLEMADIIPQPGEKVNAYGYPMGGTGLSITEGIVSRIEFRPYYYETSGLRIQVDAALNPGNSGGPVLANGKMIGLVFSGMRKADNIGYLIPVEEIKLFVDDISDGKYDGKFMMFDELQTVENDALREKLALDKSQTGMMVNRPYDESDNGLLKKWDVVSHIGKYDIDNEGKVITRDGLRLNFAYLIQHLHKKDKIKLTVIRNGKELEIDLPLFHEKKNLVPYLKDKYPSYFIYGPLVFSSVTNEHFRSLQRQWMLKLLQSSSPLITQFNDNVSDDQEELVLIASGMFSSKITKGYDNPFTQVVKEVNGHNIKSLRQLAKLLNDTSDEYIEITFAGNYVETIIFRKDEIEAATEEILTENGIRFHYSDDLKDLFKQ